MNLPNNSKQLSYQIKETKPGRFGILRSDGHFVNDWKNMEEKYARRYMETLLQWDRVWGTLNS